MNETLTRIMESYLPVNERAYSHDDPIMFNATWPTRLRLSDSVQRLTEANKDEVFIIEGLPSYLTAKKISTSIDKLSVMNIEQTKNIITFVSAAGETVDIIFKDNETILKNQYHETVIPAPKTISDLKLEDFFTK